MIWALAQVVVIAAAPLPITPDSDPKTVRVVALENAAIAISPELMEKLKIEPVKTPAGPRVRLEGAGLTLVATQFTIQVGRDVAVMRVKADGRLDCEFYRDRKLAEVRPPGVEKP